MLASAVASHRVCRPAPWRGEEHGRREHPVRAQAEQQGEDAESRAAGDGEQGGGGSQARAGWTRAARLEEEQRIAEARAGLRERARIAQEMHDSLGHELSPIALRAGALQVAADLRAAATDATDRLPAARIIGVLREGDGPVPPAPAGESVEQLVARAAESGLPVHWEPTGAGTAVQPARSPNASRTGWWARR